MIMITIYENQEILEVPDMQWRYKASFREAVTKHLNYSEVFGNSYLCGEDQGKKILALPFPFLLTIAHRYQCELPAGVLG